MVCLLKEGNFQNCPPKCNRLHPSRHPLLRLAINEQLRKIRVILGCSQPPHGHLRQMPELNGSCRKAVDIRRTVFPRTLQEPTSSFYLPSLPYQNLLTVSRILSHRHSFTYKYEAFLEEKHRQLPIDRPFPIIPPLPFQGPLMV